MIRYEKGDVLTGGEGMPCRVIVHGVNCQGVMGAGVAKAIREKWPNVYTEYKKFVNEHSFVPLNGFEDVILGSINVVDVTPKDSELDYYVINAFTQNFIRKPGDPAYKKYMSYEGMDNCMINIADWYKKNAIDTAIGMPKIGCGLGGGEWSVIESIIKHRLKGITIVVYEL